MADRLNPASNKRKCKRDDKVMVVSFDQSNLLDTSNHLFDHSWIMLMFELVYPLGQ